MRKVGGISDVMIDIEEQLHGTTKSYQQIADELRVPVDWVVSCADMIGSVVENDYCDDYDYQCG